MTLSEKYPFYINFFLIKEKEKVDDILDLFIFPVLVDNTEHPTQYVTLPDKTFIRLAHYRPKTPRKNFETIILRPGARSYLKRFHEEKI